MISKTNGTFRVFDAWSCYCYFLKLTVRRYLLKRLLGRNGSLPEVLGLGAFYRAEMAVW